MLALALVTLVGPSLQAVILVVIISAAPSYARMARTQTLSLRHAEFVLAERSLGAGAGRIIATHVLPNIVGPILIVASMDIPVVIAIEAGMSFLGLGVRPPTPSWGSDSERRLLLYPGIALARHRRRPAHHHHDARLHLPRRGAARHLRSQALGEPVMGAPALAGRASRSRLSHRGRAAERAARCLLSRSRAGEIVGLVGRERLRQIDPDPGDPAPLPANARIERGRIAPRRHRSPRARPGGHAQAARRPDLRGLPGPDDGAQPRAHPSAGR